MRKPILPFVFIFILFIAASCKKDVAIQQNDTSKIVQTAIAGVNGPTSGTVNQHLTFSLIWQNTSSLARFDHLQDSVSQNIITLRLFALTNAVDTVATASKYLNTVPYTFKATAPGVYYLKFYKTDNSDKTAITDTLIIK